MKKLRPIRYLLGAAIFIHAAVFTRLGTMIPTPQPLLQQEPTRMMSLPTVTNPHHGAQQVLKQYMKLHSVEQLERECPDHGQGHVSLEKDCPDLLRRRFAVGFYSCPHQAGNRLHHFLSAMAWSITTNRTLLWKYYDYDTCKQVGKQYDRRICSALGTRESCAQVLELHEWIPSYDDWSFVSGNWSETSFWSTHYPPTKIQTKRKHPWHEEDRKYAGIDKDVRPCLDFGQLLGQDFRDLWSKQTREYLLYTKEARNIAHRLLGDGNIMLSGDFLYGMLFHFSFSFSPSLLSSIETVPHVDNETTIAIHSRHSSTKDNGFIVAREVTCLQKMLSNVQGPCRVYAMSDRPVSVERITAAATAEGCNVSSVKHLSSKRERSFSVEHGPFAGVGLFLDLILASQARHGLLGTRRSSTMLLAELIAFARVNDEQMGRSDYRPYVFYDYEHECECTTVIDSLESA
jgi:hypothetical protein